MKHFITYFKCGHVHSQCRCPSPDKEVRTLNVVCPSCHIQADLLEGDK